MNKRSLCLVALAASMVTVASAAPVYGTFADLTGSRSIAGGGLAGSGNWTSGKSVEWEITLLGPTSWEYTYTFTGFSAPGISHMILDLTDDCIGQGGALADQGCVTGFSGDMEFREFGPEPSNPGLPAPIIGVKFDVGQTSYTFVSNRAPVWGDIYVKGGSDSGVWNVGITNHATSESINEFVARPNGISDIPEPVSMVLMGAGLVVLGYFGHRKRNQA